MARKSDKKRTARISVVITEDLREDLNRIAKAFNLSLNEFCCRSLELAAKKNIAQCKEIEKAKETFDKAQTNLNAARKNALIKFENTFAADERTDI